MAQISRRTTLVGFIGVALAACTKTAPHTSPTASPTPAAPSPAATPTPTPSPAPVDTRLRWPLTGRLLDTAKDARHAAVAVKVPDNQNEHPQRGIDQADIVFVELEGYRDGSGYSSTRLVPVFHSRMPDTVAPVRSIRPVDIALLSPIRTLIGNTGAAPWVVNYVKHYRKYLEGMLSYVNTRGTGSYGINASRIYRLNGQAYYDRAVTCHPSVLARQTKRFRSGPPQPYFPFATRYDTVSTDKGRRARSVQIPYKGDGYAMRYEFDKGTQRYLRSMPWGPHVLADGTRVSADNILVIKAHQHYGKVYRGRGHDEPLHDIINARGRFAYFHGGRYITGAWRKGKVHEPFEFTLPDGSPFKMAPGRTFVEMPDTEATLRIAG